MNYEKQMEAFYSSLNYNSISSNAIAVYTIILLIANSADRFDELSIANSRLSSICNLTTKQLQAARNELITQKYFTYKKGSNQNIVPKYTIIKLYESCNNQNRTTGRATAGVGRGVSTRATGGTTTGVH